MKRKIQKTIFEKLEKSLQKKEELQSMYDLATQEKSIKGSIEATEKTIIADMQSLEELNQQLTEQ